LYFIQNLFIIGCLGYVHLCYVGFLVCDDFIIKWGSLSSGCLNITSTWLLQIFTRNPSCKECILCKVMVVWDINILLLKFVCIILACFLYSNEYNQKCQPCKCMYFIRKKLIFCLSLAAYLLVFLSACLCTTKNHVLCEWILVNDYQRVQWILLMDCMVLRDGSNICLIVLDINIASL
jgi:hypothetical protein